MLSPQVEEPVATDCAAVSLVRLHWGPFACSAFDVVSHHDLWPRCTQLEVEAADGGWKRCEAARRGGLPPTCRLAAVEELFHSSSAPW
jgi:hypothetical protein